MMEIEGQQQPRKKGGSRASKKRAAKKRKQQQQLELKNQTESCKSIGRLLPEELMDSLPNSDTQQQPTTSKSEDLDTLVPKTKKVKCKEDEEDLLLHCDNPLYKTENGGDKGSDNNQDDINGIYNIKDDPTSNTIVDEILSQLNPYEILFPEKLIELDDEKENDERHHPLEVVKHISTEKRARALLTSILAPSGVSVDGFYLTYFEKRPLVISKSHNNVKDNRTNTTKGEKVNDKEGLTAYQSRFHGFLSQEKIQKMISGNSMKYGKDLNVTNFCQSGHEGKRRVTLDQLPNFTDHNNNEDVEYIQAEVEDVWSNYESGCTIRLLCPQQYSDEIHSLLSNFENEFGCMVGSNAYLTPCGSTNQGFAPHYDDIEAFVLQLEGYKRWLVYPPMNQEQVLPRNSSQDFTEEDLKGVEPIIDIELGPGDVLYMPRGWIHQAHTCKNNHHSLHLTVSAMQNWAWVDFLELIWHEALEEATKKSKALRSGLPRKFLSYMGTMHEQMDPNSEDMPESLKQLALNIENPNFAEEEKRNTIMTLQKEFKLEAKRRIMRVCKEALSMVVVGCDQISKRFISDRQPPFLTPQELALTSDNRERSSGKIWPNSMVRLVKPGIAHLVLENDKVVLYHCLDNSRVYQEIPLSPLEFEVDDAPALEQLVTTIEPHWICVKDLTHGDVEDKMEIAQSLYDEGLLATFQDEQA